MTLDQFAKEFKTGYCAYGIAEVFDILKFLKTTADEFDISQYEKDRIFAA